MCIRDSDDVEHLVLQGFADATGANHNVDGGDGGVGLGLLVAGEGRQLVEMMQPIVKHVTAIMLSPDASRNLKEALNSLSELPKEVQKIRDVYKRQR